MTFAVAVRCDGDAAVQAKVLESGNGLFFFHFPHANFYVPAACW
jgi:hypothetical protein